MRLSGVRIVAGTIKSAPVVRAGPTPLPVSSITAATTAKDSDDGDWQVTATPSTNEYTPPPGGGINATNSLHIVTRAGVNTQSNANSTGLANLTPFAVEPDNVGIWVYVVDYTKLASITIWVGPFGLGPNDNYTYQVNDSQDRKFNGWHYVEVNRENGGNNKTIWDNNIEHVQIQYTPEAGEQAEIYLDSCLHSRQLSLPVLVISFDDCLDEHYSIAATELNERNLPGTFYVIAAEMDTSGNMTTAQAQEMNAWGHDIAVHGTTEIGGMSQANAEIEITANRDYLDNNALTRARNHYAYPGGSYSLNAIAAVKSLGFESARLVSHPVYYYQPETGVIPDGIYNHIGVIGWLAATSVQDVKDRIDNVIASKASTFLVFHEIVAAGAAGSQIDQADFETILDYVVTKVDAGTLVVRTVSDWYRSFRG